MIEPLATLAAHSETLAWLVIAAFLAGGLAEYVNRRLARYVASGAWVLFGVFWLAVFPHFMFEVKSAVEGIGSLIAIPACLYTAYLLFDGRDSLLTLSKAVGLMGVLYFPTQAVPVVRELLIETVANQTLFVVHLLGYQPQFVQGPEYGYTNKFVFEGGFPTYIVWACTGIGSISIFGGLIAATDAPLRRKVRSFALATGVIWVLNIFRNAFVASAAGKGWFAMDPLIAFATFFGVARREVSFWIAHSVISQTLSVFALVGITWVVVHQLPELLAILEEALFVLTGSEYDLRDELGVSPVRADGGDAD